jgi:hypothetical protein
MLQEPQVLPMIAEHVQVSLATLHTRCEPPQGERCRSCPTMRSSRFSGTVRVLRCTPSALPKAPAPIDFEAYLNSKVG